MNLTISCPNCQRPLRVPENLLGQAVKCPSCTHIFTTPAPAAAEASPRPSKRRAPDDDYEEDHEEGPRPSPRRSDEKPGKVLAIAIMVLIGGILATLGALAWLAYIGIVGLATLGVGFLCCLWPGPYYGLVVGILGIVKGTRLLGEKAHREAPPQGTAIMMIINIINADIVNLILGILVLVFLSDPEVKAYFCG